MNSTKKTLEILDLSYLVYDNIREVYFQRWCALWAHRKCVSIKQMVTNDHLRNYYLDNWLVKVEQQFLKENADYIKNGIHPHDAQEIFYTYTEELNRFAPKFLLTEIKKQQSYDPDKTRSKQTN